MRPVQAVYVPYAGAPWRALRRALRRRRVTARSAITRGSSHLRVAGAAVLRGRRVSESIEPTTVSQTADCGWAGLGWPVPWGTVKCFIRIFSCNFVESKNILCMEVLEFRGAMVPLANAIASTFWSVLVKVCPARHAPSEARLVPLLRVIGSRRHQACHATVSESVQKERNKVYNKTLPTLVDTATPGRMVVSEGFRTVRRVL